MNIAKVLVIIGRCRNKAPGAANKVMPIRWVALIFLLLEPENCLSECGLSVLCQLRAVHAAEVRTQLLTEEFFNKTIPQKAILHGCKKVGS